MMLYVCSFVHGVDEWSFVVCEHGLCACNMRTMYLMEVIKRKCNEIIDRLSSTATATSFAPLSLWRACMNEHWTLCVHGLWYGCIWVGWSFSNKISIYACICALGREGKQKSAIIFSRIHQKPLDISIYRLHIHNIGGDTYLCTTHNANMLPNENK